jgi:hypothetical protein
MSGDYCKHGIAFEQECVICDPFKGYNSFVTYDIHNPTTPMTSHELTTRRIHQAFGELCHPVDDGINVHDAQYLQELRQFVFEAYYFFAGKHNYNLSDATKRVTNTKNNS